MRELTLWESIKLARWKNLTEWINKSELERILPLTQKYQEIKISKRKGGFRKISIPPAELKKVQRKILKFLQRLLHYIHCGIFGMFSGSYVEHAIYHSDSRFIFQFDIQDAFPSVKVDELEEILKKILQRNDWMIPKIIKKKLPEAEELARLIIKLTTFNNILPQGAPTSPILFEIYIREKRLLERITENFPNLKASCYIDGVVVSSKRWISPETRKEIIKMVEETGFKVNREKIWFRDCRQGNPLITGISVDGKGRICLPKKKIRRWRGIIHRAAFNPTPELINKIEGFVASLKPIYGEKLPPQIAKPYLLFQQKIKARKGNFLFN
jgi:RNA-directed DNA polymerase